MCKKICEIVIGILILIFALWQTQYSNLIIIALGVILIIHSFMCCKMCCCDVCKMNQKPSKTSKRK